MFSLFSKRKKGSIGIFYICTGKYVVFWEGFFKSCEQHFCTDYEKQYFVFTDQDFDSDNPRVHVIKQDKLGWPFDTLMRFHMFRKAETLASKCDYLFFFNSNMVFLNKVSASMVLPAGKQRFVATRHPFYYESTDDAPYETDRNSTAFTDRAEAKYYVAGGLSGGFSSDYLSMSQLIARNIDLDQQRDFIAKWHDESHWNSFVSKHGELVKILDPGFITPESRVKGFPFKVRIVVLDKENFGGHAFLRG